MNGIKIQGFFILAFILFFTSSLNSATGESQKKKPAHTLTERNKNKIYDAIIEIFFNLCATSPCCYANPRQEASDTIKKAKEYGLLKDLLLYHTLKKGNTFLHLALENNCIEVAFILLLHSNKENLSIPNLQGKLAIHEAVALNNADIITTLHAKQSDCFLITDKQGRIPLHYAVKKNALSIIDLMITLAPETINMQDKQGNTPAHVCSDATTLKIFRNHKADFTIKNNLGISVQDRLIESFELSSKSNFPDCTIL